MTLFSIEPLKLPPDSKLEVPNTILPLEDGFPAVDSF